MLGSQVVNLIPEKRNSGNSACSYAPTTQTQKARRKCQGRNGCYDLGKVGATVGATSEHIYCNFSVFSAIDTTFQ